MAATPSRRGRLVFVDRPGGGVDEAWEERADGPALPPLGRQLGGFLATAAAVARSGFQRSGPELAAARLGVCRGCVEHYRPADGRCGAETGCGCYVASKAEWLAAECILGKW